VDRSLRIFLAPDRAWLNARIEARFDAMMAGGAVEEVGRLLERRLDRALPVMRAHGVPWLIRYIQGEIGLDEAVAGGKADTRHYARRQFTWFRHQMQGWTFIPPDEALERLEALLAKANTAVSD
jgi:tRNA dimethylallyltransferase